MSICLFVTRKFSKTPMSSCTSEEWEQLITVGHSYLVECTINQNLTTFEQLIDIVRFHTGLSLDALSDDDDEQASTDTSANSEGLCRSVASLLGDIVRRDRLDHPERIISALVIPQRASTAGRSFFKLAQQLGLLQSTASHECQHRFWGEQIRLLFQSRLARCLSFPPKAPAWGPWCC